MTEQNQLSQEELDMFDELCEKLIELSIEDPEFRAKLIEKPHKVFAEHGMEIPQDLKIKVLEEKQNEFYLVIPVEE